MNKYSSFGSEVNVQCPDGKVYPMLILLMCLAMDHEATERHCLKAHNGCLCCGCRWEDYADCSDITCPPMLVEDTIRKIEEASAKFIDSDGRIMRGNNSKVDAWEKEHKVKLHWNNWFDVSFAQLSLSCVASSVSTWTARRCAAARSRRAFSALCLNQLVFHASGHHRPGRPAYNQGDNLQN